MDDQHDRHDERDGSVEDPATEVYPGTGVAPAAGTAQGRARPKPWVLGVVLVAFVALVVAGLALAGIGDDGDGRALPKLGLYGGGQGFAEAGLSADAMYLPAVEYRLGVELPDLGPSAPVYRLVAAELDATTVARWAGVFGVRGQPAQDSAGGWTVSDDAGTLSLYPDGSGGWSVSFGPAFQDMGCAIDENGTEQCWSSGSSGSASAGAAGSSEATTAPVTTVVGPGSGWAPYEGQPEAPADLPDEAEAEAVARDLLGALGVLEGDWEVSVHDGTSYGVAVACSVEADCPPAPESVMLSRSVSFTRVVDGHPVAGLVWTVEVGDGGRVASVYGVHATLEALGDYPLRTTQDAYDALVAGELTYGGPVPAYDVVTELGESGAGPSDEPMFSDVRESVADPVAPDSAVPDTAVPDTAVPAPASPETTLATEEPIPLEPVVVTVTGVELSAMLFYGVADGQPAGYVVPSYRFVGTYANGETFEAEVPAVDPAYVEVPEVPVPETAPPQTSVPVSEPASEPTSTVAQETTSIPTTSLPVAGTSVVKPTPTIGTTATTEPTATTATTVARTSDG
ncbi:MAG: hypothetical protein MUF83_03215 [Acidimicrobiales bacterium]|nr:hypothetical protein [Acidimicrobiales bacterium]